MSIYTPKLLAIFTVFFFPLSALEMRLDARAAYFKPTSDSFQRIYGGGGIYSLEYSVQAWKQVYVWGSCGLFTKSGCSIGEKTSTYIAFIPFGIGPKYLFQIKRIRPYIGLGAQPVYLYLHDHWPYVQQKTHKWWVGGIAKSGLMVELPRRFFLDFFADYSFVWVPFTTTGAVIQSTANLSGFSFGAGLGGRF